MEKPRNRMNTKREALGCHGENKDFRHCLQTPGKVSMMNPEGQVPNGVRTEGGALRHTGRKNEVDFTDYR